MLSFRIEVITPETAREYLKHNGKNRPVKNSEVETLTRAMKNGTFRTTHQGIAFDTTGRLIDGQNRLLAIVLAGVPVNMVVARGADPETMEAIDIGVKRNISDIMFIHDIGETEEEKRALKSRLLLSAINQLVANNYKKIRLGTHDYVSMFQTFRRQSLDTYKLISRACKVKNSQTFSAAIAAMYNGVSFEAIEKFFGVLERFELTGCECYNVQAALNWRSQLDKAKGSRCLMPRRDIYYGTQNAIYHFVNNTTTSAVQIPETPLYDMRDAVVGVLCPA